MLLTWVFPKFLILCCYYLHMIQFKFYSQWSWFMINNKWIASLNLKNHRVNLFQKYICNTARKPNFRGHISKTYCYLNDKFFIFGTLYVYFGLICRFVNQNIFEIFVKWHHHSAKSLSCIEFGRNFLVLSKIRRHFCCLNHAGI